jgi:hypothetical protein
MSYKIFERSAVRVDDPSVSIGDSGLLRLNAAASRLMAKADAKAVWLLWDVEGKKVGLKAADKSDRNTYALTLGNRNAGSIRAKSFLAHIGWKMAQRRLLPATWNEKERMIEIHLPVDCIDSKTSEARRRENA